jgi:hypothetical protein
LNLKPPNQVCLVTQCTNPPVSSSQPYDLLTSWNIPELDIPPEIVDQIIDALHDDKKSLAACALVYSKWLAPSRRHLFRKVALTTENIQAFLNLLDSPHSTLHKFTKNLAMEEGVYSGEMWFSESISELADKLVRVETLRVHGVSWGELSEEGAGSLIDGFQQVTSLDLDLIALDYLTPLVKLVCSFPLLEQLSCQSIILCAPDEEDNIAAQEYILPACTKSVYLRLPEERVVDWLNEQPGVCKMNTVCILFKDQSLIPCVSNYIKTIGKSLQHLELSMPLTGHRLDGLSYFLHQNLRPNV